MNKHMMSRKSFIRVIVTAFLLYLLLLIPHNTYAAAYGTEYRATCYSVEDVYRSLKEAMVRRSSPILINLMAKSKEEAQSYYPHVSSLEALREGMHKYIYTGSPKEGDYLIYSVALSYPRVKMEQNHTTGYQLTIKSDTWHHASKEQEEATDREVKKILNELKLTGKSTYEKARLIHLWISQHVAYDYEETSNQDGYVHRWAYAAYGAAVKHKAVCKGMTLLYYRLCMEAGVPCRIIESNFREDHCWNIVKMGQYWYIVDATYGSNAYRNGVDPETYFLSGTGKFPDSHHPDYSFQGKFLDQHPISVTDYIKMYNLRVNTGSGSGRYKRKSIVTIKANKPLPGTKFTGWSGNAVFVGGTSSKSKTAKIQITNDTTISAKYAYVSKTVKEGKRQIRLPNGKYLTVEKNRKKSGCRLVAGKKNNAGAYFQFIKCGNYYRIYNCRSKLYVRVKGNQLVLCPKKSATKMYFVSAGTGKFRMMQNGNNVLTVSGNNVFMKADKNAANQKISIK